jgi:hypothetical protein
MPSGSKPVMCSLGSVEKPSILHFFFAIEFGNSVCESYLESKLVIVEQIVAVEDAQAARGSVQ